MQALDASVTHSETIIELIFLRLWDPPSPYFLGQPCRDSPSISDFSTPNRTLWQLVELPLTVASVTTYCLCGLAMPRAATGQPSGPLATAVSDQHLCSHHAQPSKFQVYAKWRVSSSTMPMQPWSRIYLLHQQDEDAYHPAAGKTASVEVQALLRRICILKE